MRPSNDCVAAREPGALLLHGRTVSATYSPSVCLAPPSRASTSAVAVSCHFAACGFPRARFWRQTFRPTSIAWPATPVFSGLPFSVICSSACPMWPFPPRWCALFAGLDRACGIRDSSGLSDFSSSIAEIARRYALSAETFLKACASSRRATDLSSVGSRGTGRASLTFALPQ